MGDLNIIQYLALNFVIGKERADMVTFEKERMKYTILAGNVPLYQSLYEDKSIEDEFSKETGEVEWISPNSLEEAEKLLEMMGQIDE